MVIIKIILLGYTFGWVLTSWINKMFLYFNKLTWLKYICQKCITFWLTLIISIICGLSLFNIILAASSAAMIAYYHINKFEE
jgi:hypothetical protein